MSESSLCQAYIVEFLWTEVDLTALHNQIFIRFFGRPPPRVFIGVRQICADHSS